jgi:hypothetical protein
LESIAVRRAGVFLVSRDADGAADVVVSGITEELN